MIRTSLKALAAFSMLVGAWAAHGQEAAVSPQPEESLKVAAAESLVHATAAAPTALPEAGNAGNSMDDSGVFSERPAPGVGVSDADINTTGEADSPDQR